MHRAGPTWIITLTLLAMLLPATDLPQGTGPGLPRAGNLTSSDYSVYLPSIARPAGCATAPQLFEPLNLTTLYTQSPTLIWNAGNNPAVRVERGELAADPTFDPLVHWSQSDTPQGTTAGPHFTDVSVPLQWNTTYYWRVRLQCTDGSWVSSSIWSFTPRPIASEMVFVPAGTFRMGCDPAHNAGYDCGGDELPLHTVYIDAYYIDRTEVTNEQYGRCVRAGWCAVPTTTHTPTRPSYFGNPAYANYPAIFLSWTSAREYCHWAAGKRLPTEAEWEKAARGAGDTRPYPWGDAAPTCELANAWLSERCMPDTSPVGSYPAGASPYGALDMAGNVGELVSDYYSSDYYSISPPNNPTGPTTGGWRVMRGGTLELGGSSLRSVSRGAPYPFSFPYLGVRCVLPVSG